MDENVEKIKRLFEEGYKIIKHQTSFRKEKKVVTLKRDDNLQIVTSVNSKEFFEFMNHFKKVKDRYDNFEFVYIEDIGQYNKMVKKVNHTVLKDHHILRISGRDFSNGIMTMYFNPSGPENPIGLAQFWVDLEKNPDFINVDFKDELEVYDKENKLTFRGFIKNYKSSDKTGFIFSQDMSLKMEHDKVSAEFNKMNRTDCVGLLTESIGFNFQPHGVQYNTHKRDFIIIIPIKNLIINQSFKIGNVEFYQKFDTLDDSLIRKSETGRKDMLWNGNFPRARITVEAKQFFEAIMNGYDSISRTIDVIALRTDMSFPSVKINGDLKSFTFSYYKHLSKVKIPTWVYCREKNSHAHTFYNIESVRENTLSIEVEPQKFFEEINGLCSDLISKNNLTQQEKNLHQVFHWLRRSIQEGNKKDKLIDLWTAFEFLISGVKSAALFTHNDKSKLIKIISEIDFNDKQKNAINSKIDMLNNSSLMEKFDSLRDVLGIDFSDVELEILKNMRNKRNDLIHGRKDVLIEDNELNKMRTIIEKILIEKINSLYST
jgi:hypothetical protein